jgi:hypothetical protein
MTFNMMTLSVMQSIVTYELFLLCTIMLSVLMLNVMVPIIIT